MYLGDLNICWDSSDDVEMLPSSVLINGEEITTFEVVDAVTADKLELPMKDRYLHVKLRQKNYSLLEAQNIEVKYDHISEQD